MLWSCLSMLLTVRDCASLWGLRHDLLCPAGCCKSRSY